LTSTILQPKISVKHYLALSKINFPKPAFMASVLPHPERAQNGEAPYLARLGERVRGWRTEREVTRKALALASGVSERYLAQLEAGQGNISVLLLRRIAHAMSVPVEALVRETDPAPRRARIALVGLRGAGKSTLGERLAQALKAPFVELDREVEREAGAPLGEVFSMYGQDAFRRFEHRALERVLKTHPRAVIATGGSLVTDPETWRLLREHCYCIWLKASPEEHMQRVMAQGDMRPFRGSAAALDEIRKLLEDRETLYARADALVDTSRKSLKQTLAELRRVTETP
jgi:XRE family aerobic/anaerobic benzoate catabolism transcriptional regulator